MSTDERTYGDNRKPRQFGRLSAIGKQSGTPNLSCRLRREPKKFRSELLRRGKVTAGAAEFGSAAIRCSPFDGIFVGNKEHKSKLTDLCCFLYIYLQCEGVRFVRARKAEAEAKMEPQ
jgi:hypothetical protein